MRQYPEPIVGVFIFNSKGKLLLMKSHKWEGAYMVPGGHIEMREKIEDAISREVLEETGLKISKPEFITVMEYISEDGFYKKRHLIFLDYKARARSNKVTLNDEAQEYVWATPKEALKLNLNKFTRLTIEKYLI